MLPIWSVVFLPRRCLTPEAQIALSARFGALMRVPYVAPLPAHPEIIAVRKEADEERISVSAGPGIRTSASSPSRRR